MIGIIDYGMGNMHSVKNALEHLGFAAEISSDKEILHRAERWILPGVGAFPDAMKALHEKGLTDFIRNECANHKPVLGICLGMQLLFDSSEEFGHTEGLGLIPGRVIPIDAHGQKIPHIGWNALSFRQPTDCLVSDLEPGVHVYFVHSFRAETAPENVIAYTEYGEQIPALVKNPTLPIFGAQFHPEKSHRTGLGMLKHFCEYKENKESI